MRSVLLGYVISAGINMIVMGSLWRSNRERSPGIGLWLVDYVLQFVGIGLIVLRPVVPAFVSIVLANTFIIGGTVLLYQGLEIYLGKRTRQYFNWALLGVFVSVQFYFTFTNPSLAARSINIAVALLLICSQAAWLLLRRVDADVRPAAWPAGTVFVLFALVSVAQIFVNATGPQVNDVFKSGAFDTLNILLYEMLYIGLTFSLFLLVSRRLLTDLERDIADRRNTEAALRTSEHKFAVAFQTVPDPILLTRLSDGRIVEVNDGCLRVTGFTREEMIGRTTLELGIWANPDDREAFVAEVSRSGHVADFESVHRKKSGELFPVFISGEVMNVDGEQLLLAVFADATDRKLAEDRLRDLSDRDPLTGVLNHRAFYAAAEKRLAAADGARIALVYMDLDGLKAINDGFGHPLGDQAIVGFAEVLREAYRESDVVGRLGGDEFAVLAVSRVSASDDALLARFGETLQRFNDGSSLPFQLSASVGVAWAESADQAGDLEGLVRNADARMYEAKRAHYRAAASKSRTEQRPDEA